LIAALKAMILADQLDTVAARWPKQVVLPGQNGLSAVPLPLPEVQLTL
jgi:hypothetical protein